MIMLMDACGKMAEKLGRTDEAKDYRERSERLLDTLVNELYDGEQFVGYMTETGEYIKCQSLAMFQPLVLGNRAASGST